MSGFKALPVTQRLFEGTPGIKINEINQGFGESLLEIDSPQFEANWHYLLTTMAIKKLNDMFNPEKKECFLHGAPTPLSGSAHPYDEEHHTSLQGQWEFCNILKQVSPNLDTLLEKLFALESKRVGTGDENHANQIFRNSTFVCTLFLYHINTILIEAYKLDSPARESLIEKKMQPLVTGLYKHFSNLFTGDPDAERKTKESVANYFDFLPASQTLRVLTTMPHFQATFPDGSKGKITPKPVNAEIQCRNTLSEELQIPSELQQGSCWHLLASLEHLASGPNTKGKAIKEAMRAILQTAENKKNPEALYQAIMQEVNNTNSALGKAIRREKLASSFKIFEHHMAALQLMRGPETPALTAQKTQESSLLTRIERSTQVLTTLHTQMPAAKDRIHLIPIITALLNEVLATQPLPKEVAQATTTLIEKTNVALANKLISPSIMSTIRSVESKLLAIARSEREAAGRGDHLKPPKQAPITLRAAPVTQPPKDPELEKIEQAIQIARDLMQTPSSKLQQQSEKMRELAMTLRAVQDPSLSIKFPEPILKLKALRSQFVAIANLDSAFKIAESRLRVVPRAHKARLDPRPGDRSETQRREPSGGDYPSQ